MVKIGRGERCRIKTGTYTGDGTLDQYITGIGFRPKFVWMVMHCAGPDWTAVWANWRFDVFNAGGDGTISEETTAHHFVLNAIPSFDADGFHVNDNGTDRHPNQLNQIYYFMCLG